MATSSPRAALLLACGGSFLALLDVTITNLAVPDLSRDFDVEVTSLSWVITLYTILFAALLAPAGRLADVLGRRRLFALGVAVFTLSSALAAAAPSFAVLLGARGLQGIGAAMLLPASLAFVLADTPPERRPAAIGLWAASASVAAAVGPAIGGVLVDALDWRALFLINVPLGAWLVYRTLTLPQAAPEAGGRLPDVPGTLLLTAAIGLLVLGVTQGDLWGWGDGRTLAALAAAVLTGAWALVRSARHAAPALQIDLWRNRTYAAANVVSLLFGAGLYAWLLVGVLFLTEVWGYSELEAGFAMTPGAGASAAVGVFVGRAARKPSPRTLVIGGALLLGSVGVVLGFWLPADPHFLTVWLPAGLVLGVGVGGISVGVSSAAALSVAPARFAGATGLNIAARQVGGAIGVAILAALLSGRTPADGTQPYEWVYLMGAITCVGIAIAGLRLVLAPPVPSPAPRPAVAVAGGER